MGKALHRRERPGRKRKKRSASVERFLLIASRGPSAAREDGSLYEMAETLARRGHDVVLYLVGDAARAACGGSSVARRLGALRSRGVRLLADKESLKERETPTAPAEIEHGTIDDLFVLVLEPDRRTLWQ